MRIAKQVIVWRKDLKVGTGKFASQVGHAVTKWISDMSKRQNQDWIDSLGEEIAFPLIAESTKELKITYDIDGAIDLWWSGQFTKIVVAVNSEQELLDIHTKAVAAGLISSLIVDNGKTEFNGVPTPTCLGIGPNFADEIDPITGHLPLL
jgi:peptidyl-tRNA hydrolase, PTH2 family